MDEIIPHAYLHPLTPSIVTKTKGLVEGFVQISAQICFVARPDCIRVDFKEVWTAKKNTKTHEIRIQTKFRGGLNVRLNSDFRCMSVRTSGHSCQISKRRNTQRRTFITAAEQNPRCNEWSAMEDNAENNSLLSHAGINLSAPQL